MVLEMTDRQSRIREVARKTAAEVVPLISDARPKREFPWSAVRKMQDAGLLRLLVPAEFGGEEADFVSFCLAQYEFAKVDLGLANFISDQGVPSRILRDHGSSVQKARFFPMIVDEKSLWCLAVTEPEAGSDMGSIRTRAVRNGSVYTIDGEKTWASTGGTAGLYVILAMTDPARRIQGLTAFIVGRGTPGLQVGRELPKMGWWTMSTTELSLEGVQVPEENRLGEEGEGYQVFLSALVPGRLGIAAQSLGLAEAAFEYARDYARRRVQFGRPIAEFQAIRFMLVDMATSIEACRLLTYETAQLADRGSDEVEKFSAMAKYFVSDAAMQITTDAVQILGANGYSADYPVERMMRDAKGLQIADGTNQIMRVLVGRAILA